MVELYISITGLRLKRFWHAPVFWAHAIRSMAQARAAAGNISVDARTIEGVHHTLSSWTDRAAMRAFLTKGQHAKAMRVFPKIATGKTFGFTAAEIPDWAEVHRLWRERGCVV